VIVRGAVEPGAGVVGTALRRPRRECGEQRRLHGVLDQRKVPRPHLPGEHGHEPAVFVAEEVLGEARRGGRLRARPAAARHEPAISRISTLEPGPMTPGLSRATAIA
jgi:hypothetical protein